MGKNWSPVVVAVFVARRPLRVAESHSISLANALNPNPISLQFVGLGNKGQVKVPYSTR